MSAPPRGKDVKNLDDKEILELYWARSEQAIAETGRKYGAAVGRVARNILADAQEAEECVNDTWLAAWNAMPDKQPEKLGGFLGKLTRNFALDRWRADRRQKRGGGEMPLALEELSECVPGGGDVEETVELRELSRTVAAFVRALPEPERQTFAARYYALASMAEIAERTTSSSCMLALDACADE